MSNKSQIDKSTAFESWYKYGMKILKSRLERWTNEKVTCLQKYLVKGSKSPSPGSEKNPCEYSSRGEKSQPRFSHSADQGKITKQILLQVKFFKIQKVKIISQFRILFEQRQDTRYSDDIRNKEKSTHHPCLNLSYANTGHILKGIHIILIIDKKIISTNPPHPGTSHLGYGLGITIFKSII